MRSFLFLATLALASQAWAASYNEAVSGDLSNDRAAPTGLLLAPGANALTSTSVSGDRDYVHFSLPAGLTLDAVTMQSYSGGDDTAFIAVQAGSTFTEPPTGTNANNLLGWTHFGPNQGHAVGDNILDDMGAASPAIGFTGSLAGPDYTFWIQQTGSSASTYQLDFVVTPEPGSVAFMAIAVAMAVTTRRTRRV